MICKISMKNIHKGDYGRTDKISHFAGADLAAAHSLENSKSVAGESRRRDEGSEVTDGMNGAGFPAAAGVLDRPDGAVVE